MVPEHLKRPLGNIPPVARPEIMACPEELADDGVGGAPLTADDIENLDNVANKR